MGTWGMVKEFKCKTGIPSGTNQMGADSVGTTTSNPLKVTTGSNPNPVNINNKLVLTSFRRQAILNSKS